MAAMKPLNSLFCNMPTTIFEVMSKLSVEHNSVNLGQGFPDEEGPETMKDVAGSALFDYHNQYPSLLGIPTLRQAVAEHNRIYQDLQVDWATEALITVGATEAIASAFLALINEGDEVIMFDPMYDSYVGMCKRSGGIVKPVRLDTETFEMPKHELKAAFTEKTKLILLNTPHNPSGKVFTREELEYIAQLCIEHNVYALCDEVYEHLVFGGRKHISLRTLPGMAERTLRMGSAGKTFSFTAWKIGWITGPRHLMNPIIKAHQFLIFTVPSSLQYAVAHGLSNESSFFCNLGPSLEAKRKLLEPRLQALGIRTIPTHGAYFLLADMRPFLHEGETDAELCKRLTVEAGVTLIPVSGFYVGPNPPTHLVRFCFCKDDVKLLTACERLEAYFKKTSEAARS